MPWIFRFGSSCHPDRGRFWPRRDLCAISAPASSSQPPKTLSSEAQRGISCLLLARYPSPLRRAVAFRQGAASAVPKNKRLSSDIFLRASPAHAFIHFKRRRQLERRRCAPPFTATFHCRPSQATQPLPKSATLSTAAHLQSQIQIARRRQTVGN